MGITLNEDLLVDELIENDLLAGIVKSTLDRVGIGFEFTAHNEFDQDTGTLTADIGYSYDVEIEPFGIELIDISGGIRAQADVDLTSQEPSLAASLLRTGEFSFFNGAVSFDPVLEFYGFVRSDDVTFEARLTFDEAEFPDG
ncbi:MAG: hypothetical protein ACFBRM_03870 [Pikeienuella sp.]